MSNQFNILWYLPRICIPYTVRSYNTVHLCWVLSVELKGNIYTHFPIMIFSFENQRRRTHPKFSYKKECRPVSALNGGSLAHIFSALIPNGIYELQISTWKLFYSLIPLHTYTLTQGKENGIPIKINTIQLYIAI